PLYVQLGRCDRAIQTALAAAPWLRQQGQDLRLRQLRLQLGDYYLQLGHARAAERHLREALGKGPAPLPPAQQVAAWSLRARAASRGGERAGAERFWAGVERLAGALLEGRGDPLKPAERIDCLRKLVDAFRERGLPDRALAELRKLHALRLRQGDALAL